MKKLFGIIEGITNTLPVNPHCPEGHELMRGDYNPEYNAFFCYECYDWIHIDDAEWVET